MRTANRIVFISLGILFSAVGLADDANNADTSELLLPTTTVWSSSLASQPAWRLSYAVSEIDYSTLPSNPLFEIEFQDSSTLKQLSKLRNLSLMTLSEKWNSQVFIGVNEEGLVGLHFTWLPRQNSEHILELARLPHLKEDETPDTPEETTKYPR